MQSFNTPQREQSRDTPMESLHELGCLWRNGNITFIRQTRKNIRLAFERVNQGNPVVSFPILNFIFPKSLRSRNAGRSEVRIRYHLQPRCQVTGSLLAPDWAIASCNIQAGT